MMAGLLSEEVRSGRLRSTMRLLYLSMAEVRFMSLSPTLAGDDLVVVCRIVDVVAQIVHEVDLGGVLCILLFILWNFPEGQAARRC